MVLREGQAVGPFRVLELLGSGGMGEVWRGRDERLNRDVALEVLHGTARVESLRTRLLAEARALSALHHPHIVMIHDVLNLDDRDVLVMEYVTGEVLSARLKGRGLPRMAALEIASSIEPIASLYPAYSPEHQRLIYQRRTIDTDIVAVPLTGDSGGSVSVLIRSTHQDREAKYSPDGTRIVFISNRTGEPAVWRSNSDGTNQV